MGRVRKGEDPAWMELEHAVAEIQRQLALGGEVTHNRKVRGLVTKRQRQIDVAVCQEVGGVPLMVVFECKRYVRPVTIEKVEAFAMKLKDVGGSVGVMVSTSGFDAGARAAAASAGILLYTCREAAEADWSRVVGEEAWFVLLEVAHSVKRVHVTWHDELAFDLPGADQVRVFLGDEDGHPAHDLGTLESFAGGEAIKDLELPVGFTLLMVQPEAGLFIRAGDVSLRVARLEFEIEKRATAYPIRLTGAEGKVLETDSKERTLSQVASNGIDWEEAMKATPGIVLTQEGLDSYVQAGGKSHPFYLPPDTKKFIRVVVAQSEYRTSG
ncbi:MAG: restriction endonuclease [Fimbriimonas sp.]